MNEREMIDHTRSLMHNEGIGNIGKRQEAVRQAWIGWERIVVIPVTAGLSPGPSTAPQSPSERLCVIPGCTTAILPTGKRGRPATKCLAHRA